jgi:nucleotide-binding universal stress UspA family protein
VGIFDRVLFGIDDSVESVEVVGQVARIAPAGSRFLLVSVVQPLAAAPPGFGVLAVPLLEARREAERALAQARERLEAAAEVATTLLEGAPIPTLLAHIGRERATMAAVGIHRQSRAAGMMLGSVATALLHDAACAVYAGRLPTSLQTIRVGVDGSPESAAAFLVARDIAERVGGTLEAVLALGGKGVDVAAARAAAPGVTLIEDARGPVDALTAATAGLVVVGSRGLHGPHALGSVSERVAHRAPCSVLVVRERQRGGATLS